MFEELEKSVILANTRIFYKDKDKALKKAGELKRKYGIPFYLRRVDNNTCGPERFFLC